MFTKSSHRRSSYRRDWRLAFIATLIAACWTVMQAQAATVAGLYDASVRLTDRGDASKQAAFGAALSIVVTRVSGRRDAPAKLAAALNNAQKYVQRYGYNNGQLEVGFDSTSVNVLLEQAGLPLWGRERPTTLVVFSDALQGLREARAAVEQTAKLRGVPIVWAASEASEQFNNASAQQLQALADRYMAAGVLLAHVGDPVTASSLQWKFAFNGSIQDMQGAAEEGPHLAADVMGRYYSIVAKESSTVVMEVSGIEDLNAYATILNYLGGLSVVRGVDIESLQRDVVRFRLDLRGNAEALRRAIELDQHLLAQSSATAEAAAILAYRYNAQ